MFPKLFTQVLLCQMVVEAEIPEVGKCLSKALMVDCRYASLVLKFDLAVSMSLEQTGCIS